MSSSDKDQLTFRCPSCGASLEAVDALSVTCRYCGNSVPVPAHLRSQPAASAPQIVIQPMEYTEEYARTVRSSQRLGCIIAVVVLLFVGGIVAFTLFSTTSTIQTVFEQSGIDTGSIGEALGVESEPAFAEAVLEFGGEGSGPGLFEDPRYIAVDPDGNIFVGNYSDGRVQKFDAEGKFQQVIQVEPDDNGNNYMSGMATDYRGNLYVTRSGDILIFSTEGGRPIGAIPGDFPDTYYEGAAVDAANNVFAMHSSAGEDDLIKHDPDGSIVWRQTGIVSGVNKDDPAINLHMAVNGAGEPFIASGFENVIYAYDDEGTYVDRFGEEGTGAGQLNSPQALVVDGQDRVYVSTFGKVEVFNKSGKYLGQLPLDRTKGVPFGLAVDLDGNVYTVTNQGQVVKFRINETP